jgi:hypothetical protein
LTPAIDRLKERISSDALLGVFGALAISLTLYYTAAFFAGLNSTLSDFSYGDVIWINQAFWNFTHGRMLQTSVYSQSGEGVVLNPYSYSSQIAMHVNWFPYVFAPLYRLMPNIDGLYAIVLLWNYLGIAYFTWKILKFLSTDHLRTKFFFMLALLASGSFFTILTYKALFLLFAGPLIMAVFYFLISRRRIAFLVSALLLCLVAEDAAMFAVTFAAYAWLFHRKERSYAYSLFGLAAVYLALVIFVFMPATKYDLTLATRDSSDIVIRFKKMLGGEYPFFWRSMAPLCAFIVTGFAMLSAFFPRTDRTDWKRIAGLVILAPLSHWVISLVQGTGHHPLPVIVAAYAAMTLYAGTARYENRSVRKAPVILGAFLLGLVLVRSNVRRMRYGVIHLYGDSRLASSAAEIQSNKALIDAAASIPPEETVSYWTNRGVEGFLSSRTDIWRFPLNFDKTDYLLIQKDGDQGFYELKPPLGGDLQTMVRAGTNHSTGTTATNQEAAARLKSGLVDKAGTHTVAMENEHFLFLKRKERFAIPMPAFSLGLGWMSNIPKLGIPKVP